jgi:DNA-directed RNA polymerase subunit K/omega
MDMDDEQEFSVNINVPPQESTILIKPSMRMTSSKMSRAETAQAIGTRAEMIANGSPVYTNVKGITTAVERARKELYDGKSPLLLIRKYNGYREVFKIGEMTLPDKFRDDFPVYVEK